MRYQFVHKRNNDWSFEELAVIEKTIAFVDEPTAGDPVMAVGKYLASIISVKFLIIGRTNLPEADKIDTVCFLNYGKPMPNLTYSLKGTPCQDAYDYGVCYYPVGVKEEFPNDKDLVEMNINSYMGTALINQASETIGLIALLHDKTISNPGFIEHLLTLVSPVVEMYLENKVVQEVH